jgi:hypothetical protein
MIDAFSDLVRRILPQSIDSSGVLYYYAVKVDLRRDTRKEVVPWPSGIPLERRRFPAIPINP